jgi:hypothetical protein
MPTLLLLLHEKIFSQARDNSLGIFTSASASSARPGLKELAGSRSGSENGRAHPNITSGNCKSLKHKLVEKMISGVGRPSKHLIDTGGTNGRAPGSLSRASLSASRQRQQIRPRRTSARPSAPAIELELGDDASGSTLLMSPSGVSVKGEGQHERHRCGSWGKMHELVQSSFRPSLPFLFLL